MAILHIKGFRGTFPMIEDSELPNNGGTLAENVKPWSGALSPEPFNKTDDQLSVHPSFQPQTIYPFEYPDGVGRSTAWLMFRDDVDVARGPVRGNNLGGSVGERTYLTGNYLNRANYVHGNLAPAFTYRSVALPVSDGVPGGLHEIEIPIPPLAPVAESRGTPTNDVALRESRAYVMTFVRILDGIEEEGPPSPTSNVVNDVDTSPDLTPDFRSPADTFAGSTLSDCRAERDTFFMDSANSGALAEYQAQSNLAITLDPADSTDDTLEVYQGASVGDAYDSTAWVVRTPNYVYLSGLVVSSQVGVQRKRLYRTQTVGVRTTLHLLADIANTATTYDDGTPNTGLGEVLETEGWVGPPREGRGICFTANGIGAVFFNNVLCLCLPYIPYAWPVEFRRFTDDDIIAIAPTDNSIIIATRRSTYIATGNHPASMTFRRLDIQQGCVSKKSMRSVGSHGVVYASGEGLVAISAGGQYRQFTDGLYRREEWQALSPQDLHAVVYDGRYFYSTYTGSADPDKAALCWIDPQRATMGVVTVGVSAYALWQEEDSGQLYAYHKLDDGTYRLSELTAPQDPPAPGKWRSREFLLSGNEPPAWLRIGQARGDSVTVGISTDSSPDFYNSAVTGPRAVRLPRPTTPRTLQVTLTDIATPVTSVTMTESQSEMADFPV